MTEKYLCCHYYLFLEFVRDCGWNQMGAMITERGNLGGVTHNQENPSECWEDVVGSVKLVKEVGNVVKTFFEKTIFGSQ